MIPVVDKQYRPIYFFGVFLLTAFTSLQSQSYQIDIFGIPCVKVEMDHSTAAKLVFETRTIGIIDKIWPVDNTYTSEYDINTGAAKNFRKDIKQGSYEHTTEFTVDSDGVFHYNKKYELNRPPKTQTIFTLLARINQIPVDEMDGRWYPLEHQGKPYRLRLLWAGEVKLTVGDTTYTCDHFRLDIEPAEGSEKEIPNDSDYFCDNITHPDAVRQLWVTQEEPRMIVQASVKLFGFSLEATIRNE